MHVILVEPFFPANQRQFARALAQVGATVTAIGEVPKHVLDDELQSWLYHYEQVASVCDEEAMLRTVRWIQGKAWVDRLEATIEAHIMPTARVRQACKIPGTSVRTAFLCRDKPAMKEALRAGGIPCAQSTGAGSPDEVRAFAEKVGYPLILKPRDSAGAAGTERVDDRNELEVAIRQLRIDKGAQVAVEEFIDGHEGFYDTITVGGKVAHDFACHYFPNVLEAMRTRWISPQFISTNRIDSAPAYEEVKAMGRKVIEILGIDTSATHMEWFFGPKGLKFSEIGCRPPGVRVWDLYGAANDFDLYVEWAKAVVHGRTESKPSRKYATGMIALRPDKDGVIERYEGADELQKRFGAHVIDAYLPPAGTATQGVEAGYMANAWVRMKHTNYDELRKMLDAVGQTLKVRAR